MPERIAASIYDFPKYYDLLFGSDWKAEFDFLSACFQKHALCRVRRVFEPACGTGRLLFRFAKAGYAIGGNDLNPKAVDYCNRRLRRHGFRDTVDVGDMSDFTVRRPYHAAFNTINSFRHLSSEAAAVAHLRCQAAALVSGGLYLLGIHLEPTAVPPMTEESWSARRGHLVVNSHMWSKGIDRARRMEHLGMTIDVYTPTRQFTIEDHMEYRTYRRRQFASVLKKIPEFEVVETYDFSYDIDQPHPITNASEDVVFVLRRR